MPRTSKDATPATVAANEAAVASYAMEDRRDFEDAERDLIAPFPGPVLSADGSVIFDSAAYDYIGDDEPAPDTVNPSLWRQSQLIKKGGLYKVVDGVYQVRNNDIANLTIIEGDGGLVIVDCMAAGRERAAGHGDVPPARQRQAGGRGDLHPYPHRPLRRREGCGRHRRRGVGQGPDHRARHHRLVRQVRDRGERDRRERHVAAGVVRFGGLLDRESKGTITCGIGIASTSGPTVSYISPTDAITRTGMKRDLAGLEFEFLYAPDTEAPEEMHIWIPQLKALSCAENANHSLHNIQTLRGARTRDARNFARYLDETLELWGDEAEVHYGPHTWPVWGNADVVSFIESQRDTYKYIHDQALRLANQGYTPLEAAEVIELPEELGRKWHNRGYHGTLHHDVRAVFTKELGMWDGDPVSLHPHPPVESARRFVDFVGTEQIMAEGRRAFDAADYRWAAQVLHMLVFAQPENQAREAPGRCLRADGLPGGGAAVARSLPQCRPRAARGCPARLLRHRQLRHRSWRCRWTSCSTSSPST